MAQAVRKMRNSTGTRFPMKAMMAMAKAVSVEMVVPHPELSGPAGAMAR